MPLRNSGFFRFLFLALILSITGMSYSQSELISFFSSAAGERNFVIDSSLNFHVYNNEKKEYADFDMEMFVVVRNMEDFYIKVKKPDVINGITFVYFSDSNRIYSGYDDKFYVDSVKTSEDIVIKAIKRVLDVLSSPFFIYKRRREKDEMTVYTFSITSALFLRKIGIEPVAVSAVFSKNKLREIVIQGEKDEYVKLTLNEFLVKANVDDYFKITEY